jgi:hypothetical protein
MCRLWYPSGVRVGADFEHHDSGAYFEHHDFGADFDNTRADFYNTRADLEHHDSGTEHYHHASGADCVSSRVNHHARARLQHTGPICPSRSVIEACTVSAWPQIAWPWFVPMYTQPAGCAPPRIICACATSGCAGNYAKDVPTPCGITAQGFLAGNNSYVLRSISLKPCSDGPTLYVLSFPQVLRRVFGRNAELLLKW